MRVPGFDVTSINFKINRLTRPEFKSSRSGSSDLPKRETDTLLIRPSYLVSTNQGTKGHQKDRLAQCNGTATERDIRSRCWQPVLSNCSGSTPTTPCNTASTYWACLLSLHTQHRLPFIGFNPDHPLHTSRHTHTHTQNTDFVFVLLR